MQTNFIRSKFITESVIFCNKSHKKLRIFMPQSTAQTNLDKKVKICYSKFRYKISKFQ